MLVRTKKFNGFYDPDSVATLLDKEDRSSMANLFTIVGFSIN